MSQFSPLCLHEHLDDAQKVLLTQEHDLPPLVRRTLAENLRQILRACAAYIPLRLVSRQLENPDPGRVSGEFWDGSLLFADLSGFTSLSEQLSTLGKQGSEEVSMVVNQLFDTLVAEVLAQQGMLLKFGGDALTAFFDARTLGPGHAAAATLAALAMQERMENFAALQTRKGTFRLRLRVGVHSGKVFAAEVGDSNHIELVITGPEVNRVATAQEIAAPGEVVISDHTAMLLEGASLTPRRAGFQRISALPDVQLPAVANIPIATEGPDDIETLERLATEVAALRPYLVRHLPRRFLDPDVFEMGEFRPVTVLFANFHNFSALLQLVGDDAPLAAAILNAYFWRAQAVVHRYDGIVNKVDMYTHGDKLMVLFGAPTAHEDDPLRAVRCALELETARTEANQEIDAFLKSNSVVPPTDAQGNLTSPISLKQRIGINTGTVFAGRVGGEHRYEYTVMGSTVNLAARLMAATEDGAILLSPSTRAAVDRYVAVVEQQPLKLKGLSAPVIPSRALHAFERRQVVPSFTREGGRSPLVGRDTLLARLKKESLKALQGAGRTLALVGEAGIGKTRLTEELIHSLEQTRQLQEFQVSLNDCQSYEQSTPYAAVRGVLRQLLGMGRAQETGENDGGRRIGKYDPTPDLVHLLESRIKQLAPELFRFLPLLNDVWPLSLPDTPLTQALSLEQRHSRLQELLAEIVVGASGERPLVITFENIQWADASSLELLDHLSRLTEKSPLLLILNYRPEPPIAEPWASLPTTTRIQLNDLESNESARLLEAILNGPSPSEVLPLLERTQGNPFFIEELVRALVASNALARNEQGAWVLTQPLQELAVPSSIEGLLFARLDRLDEPCYEIVQDASVIGRRFQYPILEGVYSNPIPLEPGLRSLIKSDIILPDEQKIEISYFFRHSLLRDVAYEGILFVRRRELHRQVARCIETVSFGHRNETLAVLARHYLLAEEWMLAFFYHREAGIQAQKRYANREALALLEIAPDIAPRIEQQARATPVETRKGDGEEGSGKGKGDAPLLLPVCPLPLLVSEIHERSGYIHALLGEGEQAEAAYREALQQIRSIDLPQYPLLSTKRRDLLRSEIANTLVRLHRHIATLYEQRGDYEQAFWLLKQGMDQATTETHNELARCYLLSARIFYSQGEFEQSLEWAETARTIADYLENIPDEAQALLRIGNIRAEQGDFARSIPVLEQASTLFEQINHLPGLQGALNDLGATYEQAGRWQDAIQCYERSLQISENVGDVIGQARTSNNLALVMLGRGKLQQARRLYEFSCEQFRNAGSEQLLALSTLNLGEVLLLQEQPREAMQLFHESIEILERINSPIDLPEVLRLSAEGSLALADHEQATAYATRSLSMARDLGLALEEAMAYLVSGQIALSQKDFAAARAYLEQSHAALEPLDYRYELGKVLFWKARLARASGDLAQVSPFLQQAKDIFQELDAQRDLLLLEEFEQEVEHTMGHQQGAVPATVVSATENPDEPAGR
jgi:class 3 adenylate cyclase/tetratricopeptide (TPR) repeat protein